jgi:hypothetical protein
MIKTILVLAANPKNTPRLRLDEEVREIENGLRRARNRDDFVLKQQWAMRPVDIRRAMLDFNPTIVHFCGHGDGEEGIAFEGENGNAKLVNGNTLASFFELFADTVECVVLNACYSETQAEAIARHIKHVVGMRKSIGDIAAIEFSVAFYDAIGAGKSVEFAHNLACNAIQWAGLTENTTPVLKFKISIPVNSQLPLNKSLLAVLNHYKESCRTKDIPFYTPHLLLALITIQNGVAQHALHQLHAGLADELKDKLTKYINEALPRFTNQSFSEFEWLEREDVKRAEAWALKQGASNIQEKHLLLGVLETDSGTMKSLQKMLGEGETRKLKEIIENTADAPPLDNMTPGPLVF